MAEVEGRQEGGGGDPALAIGFPVAAIVIIFGAVVGLYGLLASPQSPRDLGINLNVWWGLFMIVVGVVILGASYASPQRRAARRGTPL